MSEEILETLEVDHVDILTDEVAPHHYKEAEDLKTFHSEKTGRGPLEEGWQKTSDPVMCSYKSVDVRLDVWGIQGRVESFVHSVRDQTINHVCRSDRAKLSCSDPEASQLF